MREVWHAKELQSILADGGAEYWPGLRYSTDEEILGIIRDSVMTVWHAAGTNKMGMANDTMAVVDPRSKAYTVSMACVLLTRALSLATIQDIRRAPFMPFAEKIAHDIIQGSPLN